VQRTDDAGSSVPSANVPFWESHARWMLGARIQARQARNGSPAINGRRQPGRVDDAFLIHHRRGGWVKRQLRAPIHPTMLRSESALRTAQDDGCSNPRSASARRFACHQRLTAAITEISTSSSGLASAASTQARAGAKPDGTQASHTLFISANRLMSLR